MKIAILGSAAAGLVFSLGLALSGMTRPSKVLGFLDVTGNWDPSLAFVMLGAIGVYAPFYALIKRRKLRTLVTLSLPERKDIDAPLVVGATIFGIGWGLGGFCPGPGIVSAASGAPQALTFAIAMVLGMGLFRAFQFVRTKRVD